MFYTENEFCENYSATFIKLCNVKSEELEQIEDSRNSLISEINTSELDNQQSEEQIKDINNTCDLQLFKLLEEIYIERKQTFTILIEHLNDLLVRYKIYAERNKMKVPENNNLTIKDYYYNYLKALYKIQITTETL